MVISSSAAVRRSSRLSEALHRAGVVDQQLDVSAATQPASTSSCSPGSGVLATGPRESSTCTALGRRLAVLVAPVVRAADEQVARAVAVDVARRGQLPQPAVGRGTAIRKPLARSKLAASISRPPVPPNTNHRAGVSRRARPRTARRAVLTSGRTVGVDAATAAYRAAEAVAGGRAVRAGSRVVRGAGVDRVGPALPAIMRGADSGRRLRSDAGAPKAMSGTPSLVTSPTPATAWPRKPSAVAARTGKPEAPIAPSASRRLPRAWTPSAGAGLSRRPDRNVAALIGGRRGRRRRRRRCRRARARRGCRHAVAAGRRRRPRAHGRAAHATVDARETGPRVGAAGVGARVPIRALGPPVAVHVRRRGERDPIYRSRPRPSAKRSPSGTARRGRPRRRPRHCPRIEDAAPEPSCSLPSSAQRGAPTSTSAKPSPSTSPPALTAVPRRSPRRRRRSGSRARRDPQLGRETGRGAAEQHVGAARVLPAARVGVRGADDHVGPAVAVDVAGRRDGPARVIAAGLADHAPVGVGREVERAGGRQRRSGRGAGEAEWQGQGA